VQLAGLNVDEVVIPIAGGVTAAVKAVSPNGLVPYLEHNGLKIWESLAIAEYCAEINPALWPETLAARTHARAISAEMHAGFRALRLAMPMNLGRVAPGVGQNAESLADVQRIAAIWAETLATFGGGPYLFGETFTAADAMFAPVMTRFLSYEPPLKAATRHYVDAVRAHQLLAAWYDLAAAEPATWRLDKYENLT
jgi:glutathione S-transferase